MSTATAPFSPRQIVYPDSDGKPMAENTWQFDWIVTLKCGLDYLFKEEPNVFVAGDLFWYPVEGRPDINVAPDTMVVFGRRKGGRLSYRQWEEDGIAPQVVFEVLSPGNRAGEMNAKLDFYRCYGVEEYYIYNPGPGPLKLSGFLRRGDDLVEIEPMHGHVSPRLKVKFEMDDAGLRIIARDGQTLVTYLELARGKEQERERAEHAARRAEQERERAERATRHAEELQAELDRLRRGTGG